jgi:DNA-binding transcriptional LysR family regulator
MPKNLDLRLVRTFVAVAEHGTLSAAARRLHVTQGAVSQQLRRLEDSLDRQLLERGRRGTVLTQTGNWFLDRARRMLEINDEVLTETGIRSAREPLRFGAPLDLVGTTLTPVFRAFTEAWPDVDLTIRCGSSPELNEELDRGSLDLAVLETVEHPSNGECLRVERLVWVGAQKGTSHRRRPLPVSMVSESCAFKAMVLEALNANLLPWRTVFESGSIDASNATVGADLAVTARLASTVPPELRTLGLDSMLPELPDIAICLHAARDGSRAATALAQCIRDEFLYQSHTPQ